MKDKKNLLKLILIIVIIGVSIVLFANSIEHIEDTNGTEDYTVETITDQDIIGLSMGSIGLSKSTSIFSDLITYSSKKFSGVAEIYGTHMVTNRFEITVYLAEVKSGNFKIVLIVDDEIVHEFKLNELSQTFVIEDVNGYICLRIAGESANFKLNYDVL